MSLMHVLWCTRESLMGFAMLQPVVYLLLDTAFNQESLGKNDIQCVHDNEQQPKCSTRVLPPDSTNSRIICAMPKRRVVYLNLSS